MKRDHCSCVSRLTLKRMLVFLNTELVHDLWKVFTKHCAMIIKGERRGRRGECPWKGASLWIKTVGVRGGWGGPVTPDLLPPGPFRAAQWLTPVSFQHWHYYYLHQSVGERGRDKKGPAVLWRRVHQPHANNTPVSPSRSLAETGAFTSPRLPPSANLFLFNHFG